MLEFKGTKGEWFSCCKDATPHYLFAGEGTITICGFIKEQDLRDDMPLEELQANARLIGASKDLLEALQFALEVLEKDPKPVFSHRLIIKKAQQAIAKALGEMEVTNV